jgi:glutathione gamma-glutamylcysteinyltransferase
MSKPKRSFFKRTLPSVLISFTSDRGREIFKQALKEGYAEVYFSLANCFATQEDPAYCGLSTLSVVLNALEIDPLRVWKGAWRWYSDDMLDCCRSLEDVKRQGITLSEFSCLARCNGLVANTVYADDTLTLESFAETIERICSQRDEILAVSYSRAVLQQTGSGHFSPIGAYCASERMVLVMDVARFKYPIYWVPLKLLWEALKPLDPATGRPRGYVILRRAQMGAEPTLVRLGLDKLQWARILARIRDQVESSSDPSRAALIRALITAFPDDVIHRRPSTLPPDVSSSSNDTTDDEEQKFTDLLSAVRSTSLYKEVTNVLADMSTNCDEWCRDHAARVTILLLAMGSGISQQLSPKTRASLCLLSKCEEHGCCATDPLEHSSVLRDEVYAIRHQLRTLTALVLDEALLD